MNEYKRNPKWLSEPPRAPRKHEAECLQLESQLRHMRLSGDPALSREEQEQVQAEWRSRIKGRTTVYAFKAVGARE